MNNIRFPQVDLANVKGVLLDIDDTLYSYDSCHKIALQHTYECYQTYQIIHETYDEFAVAYKEKRDLIKNRIPESGSCRSRVNAFKDLLEERNDPQLFSHALELDECYWGSLIDAMVLADDAKSFLENCFEKEIPICLVSDMLTTIQLRKLIKLDIQKYIRFLVTSEEVGVEKPSPQIYHYALAKLGLSPSEVIMIGDNHEKDIKGAEALGIKAYQVVTH